MNAEHQPSGVTRVLTAVTIDAASLAQAEALDAATTHYDLEDHWQTLDQLEIKVLCWENSYVECPGSERHTKPNAASDCKCYNNNGILRLHCFHQHCSEVIEATNAVLCDECRPKLPRYTREQFKVALATRDQRFAERQRELASIQAALTDIKRDYPWQVAQMLADSPVRIGSSESEHGHALLKALFAPEDILWCGRYVEESGHRGHSWRFQTAQEWLAGRICPGPFTCPTTFNTGVYSRSTENVATNKYLVVESDTLSHGDIGAVLEDGAGQSAPEGSGPGLSEVIAAAEEEEGSAALADAPWIERFG